MFWTDMLRLQERCTIQMLKRANGRREVENGYLEGRERRWLTIQAAYSRCDAHTDPEAEQRNEKADQSCVRHWEGP
jgi:hypothetical protein